MGSLAFSTFVYSFFNCIFDNCNDYACIKTDVLLKI